jgi:hypothetical protein
MIEPTTLAEKYARAINSSHLEVCERRRGDVDLLIAAGWVPEHVGTMLYRLAVEFDEARGDTAIVRRNHTGQLQQVHSFSRLMATEKAKAAPDTGLMAKWKDRIREIQCEIDRDLKVQRAFILLKLKSLPATKEAFGQWARVQAAKRNFMPLSDPGKATTVQAVIGWREEVRARDAVIVAIAGRLLEIMLDPLCTRCEGRGFNGGYDGSPQSFCKHCVAGRRKVQSRSDAEEAFAGYLHLEADKMLNEVDRKMRAWLRDPH